MPTSTFEKAIRSESRTEFYTFDFSLSMFIFRYISCFCFFFSNSLEIHCSCRRCGSIEEVHLHPRCSLDSVSSVPKCTCRSKFIMNQAAASYSTPNGGLRRARSVASVSLRSIELRPNQTFAVTVHRRQRSFIDWRELQEFCLSTAGAARLVRDKQHRNSFELCRDANGAKPRIRNRV